MNNSINESTSNNNNYYDYSMSQLSNKEEFSENSSLFVPNLIKRNIDYFINMS